MDRNKVLGALDMLLLCLQAKGDLTPDDERALEEGRAVQSELREELEAIAQMSGD